MEQTVLIDSNVYIDLLRQRRDPVRELGARFDLTDIACCGIVRAEVLRGVQGPKLRDALSRFFSITQMIGTTERLWEQTWQLAWQLDRQGRVLPLTDIIIAACALSTGAAVMTRDAHFSQIPDLRVIRP